jgi:hypothetical protein
LADTTRFFGNVRQTWRELGWLNTLFYCIHRILAALGSSSRLHRYYFVAQPIPEKPLLSPRRGGSVIVKPEAPENTDGLPLSQADIEARLKRGDKCFSAYVEDRVVGYLWLCFVPFDESEVRCRFVLLPRGKTAWDFDIFIRPEFRIGFVFARLWDSANQFLIGRGVSWTMSRISAFNAVSMVSHRSLGAQRLGSAIYLILGYWQFMLATVPPYLHLSMGPDRVPAVYVTAPNNLGNVNRLTHGK